MINRYRPTALALSPIRRIPAHGTYVAHKVITVSSNDIPKVHELHVSLPHLSLVHYSICQISFGVQFLVLPARTCLVAYPRGQPNVPIAFISAVTRPPASTQL